MPRSVMGDNNSLVLMMAFSMNVFMSSEIGSIPGIVRNLKADILNDFLKLSKVDFSEKNTYLFLGYISKIAIYQRISFLM